MSEPARSLPERFPIFPLRGALLLPNGNLPLNIFEPRYLAMIRDAMQTDRVIGMVQPRRDDDHRTPEIYGTGCVGRITNMQETPDGRYLITLTGVCRFDVAEELEVETLYRQVVGDYRRWRQDLQPDPPPAAMKSDLVDVLRIYFDKHGIEADWKALEQAPLAGLVTSLAMICPFEPSEKQALLEATDLTRQTKLLLALMQMDCLGEAATSTQKH